MADVLAESVRKLRSGFGADPAKWGWGHIRRLTLEHPLSVVKPLAPLLNRGPFPWGGDANTISQAGSGAQRTMPGNPGVIAALRLVIDVGNWDRSRYVLPGGQSGNPFSPHYDDLLPLWLRGEGVPIPTTPLGIAEATRTTLTLLPLPSVVSGGAGGATA
jgi:penicillin amidase